MLDKQLEQSTINQLDEVIDQTGEDTRILLCSCSEDMTSHDNYQKWPESGYVEIYNWNPGIKYCKWENKLLGLPWGCGDVEVLNPTGKWLIVERMYGYVDIRGDKSVIGFKSGNVILCGTQQQAADWLLEHGGDNKPIVGCNKTGGDYCKLVGGGYSTLIGGDYSTLTAGDHAYVAGGKNSIITGGRGAILKGGCGSRLQWEIKEYFDNDSTILTHIYKTIVGRDNVFPDMEYSIDGVPSLKSSSFFTHIHRD